MDDEISMQPFSKCEHYSCFDYPIISTYFFACANLALGMLGIGIGIYYFDKGGGVGIFLGAVYVLFFYKLLKSLFESYRPLVIDDIGISAWAFGRPWQSIVWPDIQRIEKIRRLRIEEKGNRYAYTLVIIGSQDRIIIEDRIRNLYSLVFTLNEYVQRYQIPLVARDKGDDTLVKIKATVKDKQERKKLLKEGLQSSIAEL